MCVGGGGWGSKSVKAVCELMRFAVPRFLLALKSL